MERAARTIYWFSGYLLVVGVTLAVIPNVLLAVLGLEETGEMWIRLLGMASIVLALYYFDAARSLNISFFTASLLGRGFAAAVLVVLAAAGNPWQLLIVAGIELVSAAWTYTEMRALPA